MSIQPYNKAQQGSLPGSDRRYLDQELLKIQTAIGSIEQAFGVWTAYTPVVSAGTGTLTTVSATGRYTQVGKLVFIQMAINITTNGSGAVSILASLPAPAVSGNVYIGSGRETSVAGFMTQNIFLGNNAYIEKYDGTYPGGNGYQLIVSGFYEAA